MTAEERRDMVLDAAVVEFAAHGLSGASTETIAARVGISQPYIFRLFGTKKNLFIAASSRVYNRVHELFRTAAAAHPDDPLTAMAQSYKVLLAHREELLLLLQSFAASDDQDVQREMRYRYGELYRYVQHTSGASDEQVRIFFAFGMLHTIAAALDFPQIIGQEDGACKCLGFATPQ